MNERDLFLSALEIEDPAARKAHLQSACAGNGELLTLVESLLASHEGESQFLQTPIGEQLGDEPAGQTDATLVIGAGSTHDESPGGSPDVSILEFLPDQERIKMADEIPLGYLEPSTKPDSLGRLAHYEILEVVGSGAFGTVLRAFDDKLQRVVAIKVMAPELASTSPARKRFIREAQASAAIRHENVVSVYAVEEKPIPYLVMEFIPGLNLQQRLDERGPLDVVTVLRMGTQIAEGLAAAHAKDLIHRDIKPGNILLESGMRDRVKITDFGLARAADDASMTQSGTIAGTPMYMAPEQALGHKLDQRADLFSFGSVLYQMVSGRPPFRASSTLAVLKRLTEDTARPIREIIPETPTWLCDIIAKLHAKNPDERYQSAREIADVLANCESQLKEHSRLKDLSLIPRAKPQPAGWWKWVAAAALVLPLLAIALYAVTRPGSQPKVAGNGSVEPTTPDPTPVSVAKEEPLPPTFKNSIGMEFVMVPKGKSWLGGGKDKLGDKEVEIPADFYLGKYEVTQEEWEKVMGENPSWLSRTGGGKEVVKDITEADLKRFPLENVTWDQCQVFVAKLNKLEKETGWVYRLPTEAEWEYACRGGPMSDKLGSAFDFYLSRPTNVLLPEQANFQHDKGLNRTSKVGSYAPNVLGLYDMHGNAWEWCQDQIAGDPKNPEAVSQGVSRGSGWYQDVSHCPAANRYTRARAHHYNDLGLRLARVPSGVPSPELTTPLATGRFAMAFDGEKSVVRIPSLKIVKDHALTVEAWAVLEQTAVSNDKNEDLVGNAASSGFVLSVPYRNRGRTAFSIRLKNPDNYVLAWEKQGGPRHQLIHFAGVYDGKTEIRYYVNGQLQSRRPAERVKTSDKPVVLGNNQTGTAGFLGRMNGVRLSKVARYDNDFTPDNRWVPDTDTLALYHFDEGQGAVLKDSSGNGHHGEIVGAKWVQADGSATPVPSPEAKTPPAAVAPFTDAEVQRIAALPAAEQVEEVRKELMRRNPGLDGTATHKIEDGVVTEFVFTPIKGQDVLTDISPLRALLGLTYLNLWSCSGLEDLEPLKGLKLTTLRLAYCTQIQDFTPLKHLPLTVLHLNDCQVRDLEPFKDMKLTRLDLVGTPVRDLELLKGMPLKSLSIFQKPGVTDLRPLQGMELEEIHLTPKNITQGLDILRAMKSLKTIGIDYSQAWPPAEFWERYDKGEFAAAPFTDAEVQRIAALPAAEQVEEIRKELVGRNHGFDGKLKPTIENDVVTELSINSDEIIDIAPMRALTGLIYLDCRGTYPNKGKLSDLSPLKGMTLGRLDCSSTQIADLTPLAGLPLSYLHFNHNPVSDLTPLKGMPLLTLGLAETKVSDLSPLKGMKLKSLGAQLLPVTDLSPLEGMPLTGLDLYHTVGVTNLEPLKGMPLEGLNLQDVPVSDLSPLKGMTTLRNLLLQGNKVSDLSPLAGLKLTTLLVYDKAITDLSPLKGIPLIRLEINGSGVSDLRPLQGMPLRILRLNPQNITQGIDVLRDIKSLEIIGIDSDKAWPPAEFWQRYDKGEFKE